MVSDSKVCREHRVRSRLELRRWISSSRRLISDSRDIEWRSATRAREISIWGSRGSGVGSRVGNAQGLASISIGVVWVVGAWGGSSMGSRGRGGAGGGRRGGGEGGGDGGGGGREGMGREDVLHSMNS
jgi:hypothetical protein